MHRWRPTVEGNCGPSTRKTNEGFVRAINAEFGGDVELFGNKLNDHLVGRMA
jgi:hypothetical protein